MTCFTPFRVVPVDVNRLSFGCAGLAAAAGEAERQACARGPCGGAAGRMNPK